MTSQPGSILKYLVSANPDIIFCRNTVIYFNLEAKSLMTNFTTY